MAGKHAKPNGSTRAAPAKRSARAVVAEHVDDPAPANEGARLLCAVRGSVQLIADAIGASKQAVSTWRTGVRVPEEQWRRQLHAVHAIPLDAWDRPPHSASKNRKSNGTTEPEPEPAPWFPIT